MGHRVSGETRNVWEAPNEGSRDPSSPCRVGGRVTADRSGSPVGVGDLKQLPRSGAEWDQAPRVSVLGFNLLLRDPPYLGGQSGGVVAGARY